MFAFLCVFSMKQLRDRVTKLKEEHGHIYHLVRTEGKPSINWGNMMDEKLVNKNPANMNSSHSVQHSLLGPARCYRGTPR